MTNTDTTTTATTTAVKDKPRLKATVAAHNLRSGLIAAISARPKKIHDLRERPGMANIKLEVFDDRVRLISTDSYELAVVDIPLLDGWIPETLDVNKPLAKPEWSITLNGQPEKGKPNPFKSALKLLKDLKGEPIIISEVGIPGVFIGVDNVTQFPNVHFLFPIKVDDVPDSKPAKYDATKLGTALKAIGDLRTNSPNAVLVSVVPPTNTTRPVVVQSSNSALAATWLVMPVRYL